MCRQNFWSDNKSISFTLTVWSLCNKVFWYREPTHIFGHLCDLNRGGHSIKITNNEIYNRFSQNSYLSSSRNQIDLLQPPSTIWSVCHQYEWQLLQTAIPMWGMDVSAVYRRALRLGSCRRLTVVHLSTARGISSIGSLQGGGRAVLWPDCRGQGDLTDIR